MLSNRSSAPTLLGFRPSAQKSLGRSQKRFQLLTKSCFCSLHHDNNHSFNSNSLTKPFVSSSIRRKRSLHDDRRHGRCAAYRLDQAPEVPLQCLRLLQLGVVNPRVNHNSCNALVALQDRGYLHRNIANMSTRETVSVHFTIS